MEMASNGNRIDNAHLDDMGSRVSVLSQRVATVEYSLREIAQSIANLSTKFEDRNKPQWNVLLTGGGFILALCVAIGTLAYWPIRETNADLKAAVVKIADTMNGQIAAAPQNYVTRLEATTTMDRNKEDRERVNTAIKDLRDSVFPREVHLQRWAKIDGDISVVREEANARFIDQQRQLDELKRIQADTYSARDVLFDLRSRIDGLNRDINQLRSGHSG